MKQIQVLTRGRWVIVGLILINSIWAPLYATSQRAVARAKPHPYPNHELIIQFKKPLPADVSQPSGLARLDSLNSIFGATSIAPLLDPTANSMKKIPTAIRNIFLFSFDTTANIPELQKAYRALDIVAWVEPNYFYTSDTTKSKNASPPDQCDLIDARMPAKQSRTIVIGIVDAEVDWKNPDLTGKLWTNTREKQDGKDNDFNGYPDDIHGWNFVTADTADYRAGTAIRRQSGVVETIVRATSPAQSAYSLNYRLMVLPAGYFTKRGDIRFSAFDASRAIFYAAEKGVDILVLPWFGEHLSKTLHSAIAHARSKGCNIMCAAGDRNSNRPYYPAAFDSVWAVTAVDEADRLLPNASFGQWVDVAAPGFIPAFSAADRQSDKHPAGTSIAAAYVAALAARLLCCDAIGAGDSLMHRILWSCENIYEKNPDHEGELGAGRINFKRASDFAYRPNFIVQRTDCEKDVNAQLPGPAEKYALTIFMKNLSSAAEVVKITLLPGNPGVTVVNPEIHVARLDFNQEFNNQSQPFLILTSQAAGPEHPIRLKLIAEAADHYQFTKEISIQPDELPIQLTCRSTMPVQLNWSPVRRALRYRIFRKAGHETIFQILAESPAGDSLFIDATARPGADYDYSVTGIDGSGAEIARSESIPVTVPPVPYFLFHPQQDTVAMNADSLLFSCSILNSLQSDFSYFWEMNGLGIDVRDSAFLFIPPATGSDSLTRLRLKITFTRLDTAIVHDWILVHPTANRAVPFTYSPCADTTLTCGDSVLLRIEPFSAILMYQWAIDGRLDSSQTSNRLNVRAPWDSIGATHIAATISLGDTSQSFAWIIRFAPAKHLPLPAFFPTSDTTVSAGDSVTFSVSFPRALTDADTLEWAVNGVRDSSSISSPFTYWPQAFPGSTDTISLRFEMGDSVCVHDWRIAVLHRNRAPEILVASALTDSLVAPGDTLRFHISARDPDSDSLRFSWRFNRQLIAAAEDSIFALPATGANAFGDTIDVGISDADTTIHFLWVVHYLTPPADPWPSVSFFPHADSALTKPDSIHFKAGIHSTAVDSVTFQWFVNGLPDTTARDSYYWYVTADTSRNSDTVRVEIAGLDSLLSHEWIITAKSPTVIEPTAPCLAWYPAQDSIDMASDSIRFSVSSCRQAGNFQWYVNQQLDSSATDSSFILHPDHRVHDRDTVRVCFNWEDSLVSHQWFVLTAPRQRPATPISVRFSPADSSLACAGNDSVKLAVTILTGELDNLSIRWYVNQKWDSLASDTLFHYSPSDSMAGCDTVAAVVANADTVVRHVWRIESHATRFVPAPRLIFPIKGNKITEANTFLWENDSTLADMDFGVPEYFVFQLSQDSTFARVISSDTCASPIIALNEVSAFSQLPVDQPIYWRVRLMFGPTTLSRFVRSPQPVYYLPLFVTLENFSAGKNENGSITLLWATQYEANCAGFNVFRSEFPDENFNRINENLITGAGEYSFQDATPMAGKVYYYKLEEITLTGHTKFHDPISVTAPTPANYSLSQNYPNPFNHTTSFKFQIPTSQYVLIEVYNVLGRKLRTLVDERREAGYYTVSWDGVDDQGMNVVSGVYFYHISANGFHMTHKMVVVR
ncbi:MAG: S8 family serine peptidase [Candidatus Zhuqueibacterota bacterium]